MSLTHVEDRPTPADCRADSRLQIWEAGGKRFFVLTQKGRFADLCYDHGRMLAKEIEDGVFPEILATIAHDVDASPNLETGAMDSIQGAFFNRLSKDVLESSSQEFRDGVAALAQGCLSQLSNPMFNEAAVEHACVAIDTGNIATGFNHLVANVSGAKRTGHWLQYAVLANIFEESGRSYDEIDDDEDEVKNNTAALRNRMRNARGRRRAGMGCTGLWSAPGLAADGRGLHARNFDGAFFAWNRYPVLHLIDETPENASWQRYAAVGTAGLVYPGGISGVNEAGIAVSLHQMSTVNFTAGDGSGDFDVAPYVQQRMLREAKSLDDAVDIARSRNHFASWTILVSHAPSGKALRVELNGARDDDSGDHINKVEASAASERMVQSNHFLSEALKERHNLLNDAHFTKTVGKWMETRARLATADKHLAEAAAAGEITTKWALNTLANHNDESLDGDRRSFGRTICKAYSLMGSIARASADRADPDDEIWFTLGDRMPGPHSTLVGFAIDWQALSFAPVGTHVADTVPPAVLSSMDDYIEAFSSHDRPRRPNGDYVRRRPTDSEMQNIRRLAIADLDNAIETLDDASVVDPVYRYVRARLCHDTAMAIRQDVQTEFLQRAAEDWAWLRDKADGNDVAMTDWERALIYILSAATKAAQNPNDVTAHEEFLETGRTLLEGVAHSLFGGGSVHHDIKVWRKVIAAIDAEGGFADLPSIDWVTVE